MERSRLLIAAARKRLDSPRAKEVPMSRTVKATALTGVRSLAVLLLGGGLLTAPVMAGAHDDGGDDEGDTIHRTRPHQQFGSRELQITTVSTRNDLVTGGDVLVRIGAEARIPLGDVRV